MSNVTTSYYGFSRPEVVAVVQPKGKRVLDIGCAGGAMGSAMLEAGATEVVGVEIVPEAAKLAREKLTAVYQLDLEKLPELPYPDGHFDVITFADVLEHVRDPVAVLKHLRRYVKNEGTIVCSIPNVRHESVLLPLVFNGTFKYQDAGILDRTHLRFFTLAELHGFMRETGFEVLAPMQAVRSQPGQLVPLVAEMVTAVGGDGKAFAEESTVIQYVFQARPAFAAVTSSAETVVDQWTGSRPRRVLFVPPSGAHAAWEATLTKVIASERAATIGVMLPTAELESPPQFLVDLANAGSDICVIEEPKTLHGWQRVIGGASKLVVMPQQFELKKMAEAIGVEAEQVAGSFATPASAETARPTKLYLDMMKRTLSNVIYADGDLARNSGFDMRHRAVGRDWPERAHTMIGLARLENIQKCVEDVIARGVPGHFIETGVWRGGATIFMRAILAAYDVRDRKVFVADSFEGLPPPNPELYPADAGDKHFEQEALAISLEQVQRHFELYGLLDEQVHFLKGWFKDTLPTAPIDKLAVVRLDGDMYESTMDGFNALYDKLSPGGYLIVDDFGAVPACRKAVEDFRAARGITETIVPIDWTGVYWQKR